ncbi:MAG: hypothetical protein FWD35_02840 [Oscillospiraceae bacterium]|nr:hypothetical protein [Oscillospiraceae bacterium]
MEWFSNWWTALDAVEQVLYCVAIPSSLFLIVQAILIIVGGDFGGDSGGLDMGDLGDGFDYASGAKDFGAASMLSIQGVASFFCAASWGALLLYQAGIPLVFALIAALLAGLAVMFAIAKMMLYLGRLAHCGTLEVQNLIGSSGTVYLKIPPHGKGKGKVTVQTSERLVEFEAVSKSEEVIPNNAPVKVIDIMGENILVVEAAT